MDTIASCAFGVDADALTDNDSVFLYRGRKLFKDNENQAGIMKLMIPLSRKFTHVFSILHWIIAIYASNCIFLE